MSETTYDFDFRPDYWEPPSDPIAAITRNVKGELRRRMIADIVSGEAAANAPDENAKRTLSEVYPDTLPDSLDDPSHLGRTVHPAWFGGEFLPDYLPGEVETARIVLASVTMDVISIRARPEDARIHYRVVDEYPEYDWFVSWAPRASDQPLTFRELIGLIDSIKQESEFETPCDSYIEFFSERQVYHGAAPEEAAWFARVASCFYPQLEEFYRQRAKEWLARKNAELEAEVAEEESQ